MAAANMETEIVFPNLKKKHILSRYGMYLRMKFSDCTLHFKMSLHCRWLRADEDARTDWIVVPVEAPRIEWHDFIHRIVLTCDLPVLANYIKRSERDFCVSRVSEADDVVMHDASGGLGFPMISTRIVYLSNPDRLWITLCNIVEKSPTTLLFKYLVKRFNFHCSCEFLSEISEIVFERSMKS